MRRYLPALNVAVFLLTLVTNTLANSLPLNGKSTGDLAEMYPTLFIPARFTFLVWGVIYLGLGLLVYYQAGLWGAKKDSAHKVVDSIGGPFLFSSILNIAWVFAWHYERVVLSSVIMVCLALTLALTYWRLQERTGVGRWERRFVHIPISVYLSWVFTLSIANVSVALISRGWQGSGLSLETWTVTGLVVVGVVTWSLLTIHRDIWFAATSVWAASGALVRHVVDLEGQYPRIMVWLAFSILLVSAKIVTTLTRKTAS